MADQDPELQAIRAARLAQLQASKPSSGAQAASADDNTEQLQKEAQMKRDLLATVLDSGARERCESRNVKLLRLRAQSWSSVSDCARQFTIIQSNRGHYIEDGPEWPDTTEGHRRAADWLARAGIAVPSAPFHPLGLIR